jgi:ribonuclease HII
MEELSQEFSAYKWHKNSGYGTKDHINAILQNGRTSHHRRSFKVKGVDY